MSKESCSHELRDFAGVFLKPFCVNEGFENPVSTVLCSKLDSFFCEVVYVSLTKTGRITGVSGNISMLQDISILSTHIHTSRVDANLFELYCAEYFQSRNLAPREASFIYCVI